MRKKILFVIESLAGGGAEKVLITLLKHLDASRFDMSLCCITRVGKYLEDVPSHVHFSSVLEDYTRLSGLSLLLYKIKYKLIYNWLPVRWVYNLYIPHGNDVEVAFLEGNATRILSGSSNKGARRIAWVHNDMKADHWTGSIYRNKTDEEQIYNRFDLIIAVSKSSGSKFKREFPRVKTPVRVYHNPIDREEILRLSQLSSPDVPDRNGTCFRLVSIGRLAPQKAFDRLIRVFKKILDDGIPAELWILGEGDQHEALQGLITLYQLDRSVVLWGFQKNPYCFLPKCDLFVCSSLTEGYSTAATEAVILGLPVVTTACSGMDELLLDGTCGLISDNEEIALYHALKEVLTDSEVLSRYHEAALQRSLDFSLEKAVGPIEAMLEG
ncbi:MAG: glycosyltransferase [Bacteroidales bacterium]|nr:glycosyltransferase [Bacteroidales bacterium]